MALAETTVRTVARGLAADVTAAEVLAAFAERGIPSLLLKGPATATLLYAEDEVRAYGDVDLLVPPAEQEAAEHALRALRFVPLAERDQLRGHRPLHAAEWIRPDGVSVDLHRTISGAAASPERVWDVLRARAVHLTVGKIDSYVPGPGAVALLVALHAAHHGRRIGKGLRELGRALDRCPEEIWREAAALAVRIDAGPAFAAGLALDPRGVELGGRLGLPAQRPVDISLRATSPPPLALGLDWLARTPGLRSKTRLALRTTFPAPGAMRAWRPVARRGRASLGAAYATHPFWLAWHLPSSVLALRRARREAR